MNNRRGKMIGGVIAAGLSFACFSAMDSVEPYSTTETALNIAGYLLCGLAIGMLYAASRSFE